MSMDTRRLFFALWPDLATRVALDQTAASLHVNWGGRQMPPESLHLTLAFLGDTPVVRLDELHRLAAAVIGRTFTLKLDSPGCWQQNRVGWLGVKETPPALTLLVSHLRRALRAGQFPFDDRRYVPHVTLLRNAHCGAPPPCPPLMWNAQNFALLHSPGLGATRGYTVLGRWPLARGAP